MLFRTFIAVWCLSAEAAIHDPSVQPLIDQKNYKDAISAYEAKIKESPSEKQGWLKSRLAIIYYKDQDQEKAFKTFLGALETTPQQPLPPISKEEQILYDKAIHTYLDQSNASIQETASQIQKEYTSILKEHPDYRSLKLVVALAEANLGSFEDFFVDFYDAYPYQPDHHLSYKTKAILHIKLFERARTKEEKEIERNKILNLLKESMNRFPADRSLYRIMISFSPDGEARHQAVILYLPKILDQNIMVPRCDILFYVQQAVAVQELDLAQRLIDKGREWYQYSKALEMSQIYLDQHKR